MFSKVYKQKFFSSPATDKKAQAFENTRVFRKLAFKGSSRNSVMQDIGEDIGKDKRMQWRALQDREKAYQAYQGIPKDDPHTQEKNIQCFQWLMPKGQFLIIIP